MSRVLIFLVVISFFSSLPAMAEKRDWVLIDKKHSANTENYFYLHKSARMNNGKAYCKELIYMKPKTREEIDKTNRPIDAILYGSGPPKHTTMHLNRPDAKIYINEYVINCREKTYDVLKHEEYNDLRELKKSKVKNLSKGRDIKIAPTGEAAYKRFCR
jgi:hypothetical protein